MKNTTDKELLLLNTSRGYLFREDVEEDIPEKFRKEGSTTYYDKKKGQWYIVDPE